jgi:hypothetical protein
MSLKMNYDKKYNKEMKSLFERAIKEGLWFYQRYYDMWFSPKELKQLNKEGHYKLLPKDWELRNPQEIIDHYKWKIVVIKKQIKKIKERIKKNNDDKI